MDIGIDLGSSRTRVFVDKKGIVLDEASVAAYNVAENRIIAVGDEAYNMVGKTPESIQAEYPLAGGVIAQSLLAEDMVNILLKHICTSKIVMPRVVASIPGDITEVEKRAVVNAISSFGVRRVFLIENTKVAAMGAGADIMSAHGTMVANLGAGTSNVAILSLGGLSVSKTIKVGGNDMDEDIVKYVRKKYSLIIGQPMAEKCKIAIGCLTKPEEEKTFRVKGRDAISGLPRFVDVTSSEIMEVLMETAAEIVTLIKDVLEEAPPELVGDVYSDGILLTGGLANIDGFAQLIADSTEIKVTVADSPEDCVIIGCGKAINYIAEVERNAKMKNDINPLMAAY
ncbi:MAG: rod shape-determining protein [Ruminococcus sp.]|nr:rod shape-determining protein [Ruminococcus sp.]